MSRSLALALILACLNLASATTVGGYLCSDFPDESRITNFQSFGYQCPSNLRGGCAFQTYKDAGDSSTYKEYHLMPGQMTQSIPLKYGDCQEIMGYDVYYCDTESCGCTDWVYGSCGDYYCSPNEVYKYRSCSPSLCAIEEYCQPYNCIIEYCGDGLCNNGETCSSCPGDCGVCFSPPPAPYCGDGSCNNGETCSTCPGDCGSCCPGGCDDGNACTLDYCTTECIHELITPCIGNGLCENGENYCNAPSDCSFSCGTCQLINCDYGSPLCVYASNCCGNGVCETGEDCNNCASDCGCALSIDLSSVECSINGVPCSQVSEMYSNDTITAGFDLNTESNQGVENVLVTFSSNGFELGSITVDDVHLTYSFTLDPGRQNVQARAFDQRYNQEDDKLLFSLYITSTEQGQDQGVAWFSPFEPNSGERTGEGDNIPDSLPPYIPRSMLWASSLIGIAAGAYALISLRRSYFLSLLEKTDAMLASFFNFLFPKHNTEETQGTYVPVETLPINEDNESGEVSFWSEAGNVISSTGKTTSLLSIIGFPIGILLHFTPAAPFGPAVLAVSAKAFTAGIAAWGIGEATYFISRGVQAESEGRQEEFSSTDSGRLAEDAITGLAMAAGFTVGKLGGKLYAKYLQNKFDIILTVTYTDDEYILAYKGKVLRFPIDSNMEGIIDDIKINIAKNPITRRNEITYAVLDLNKFPKDISLSGTYKFYEFTTPAGVCPIEGTNKFIYVRFSNRYWGDYLLKHGKAIEAHELIGETIRAMDITKLPKINEIELPAGLTYDDFLGGLSPDVIASKFTGSKKIFINARLDINEPNWWKVYPDLVKAVEKAIPPNYNPELISDSLSKGLGRINAEVINIGD